MTEKLFKKSATEIIRDAYGRKMQWLLAGVNLKLFFSQIMLVTSSAYYPSSNSPSGISLDDKKIIEIK